MTKHFVKILYAGTFVSEESHKGIQSRTGFILPDRAYAYQFYDREVETVNGEELTGKPKNHSKTFIKGEVFTLEDVKAKVADNRILVSNMEGNGWNKVIRCKQGFIPFNENEYQTIN